MRVRASSERDGEIWICKAWEFELVLERSDLGGGERDLE